MKKIFIQTALLLTFLDNAFCQQDAMFSQYMFTMLNVNPAYAGSRDVLSATALRRWQWVNVDGAPRTTMFAADMPIMNEKIGVGLVVLSDRIGVTNTTGLYGSGAYRIRLRKGTLAMGLSAGFAQYKADFVSLENVSSGDPLFMQNVNKLMPNFGTGVYYNTDKYYVGLSAPHLMNNKLTKESVSQSIQKRHMFLTGGVVLKATELIKLKPSTLIKYVPGAPLQFDANLNVWYDDRIGLGASYRTGDAVVAMLELQLNNQLRLGYAYDISLTGLSQYTSGSHELMLRYEFGFEKSKMITPRYF